MTVRALGVSLPIVGLAALIALSSCGGGQQEPAESPDVEPMPEGPPPTDVPAEGAEGTHTMPDGTTMPGETHEDTPPAPDANQ